MASSRPPAATPSGPHESFFTMIIAALLVLLGSAAPTPTASEPAATAETSASATATVAARAEAQPAAPSFVTVSPRTRAEVRAEAIDALRTARESGRH